jgi:hypothetical protein
VRPAQQRLDPGQTIVDGVDDRLVVEVQFAAADRAGQATGKAGAEPTTFGAGSRATHPGGS